jgi:secreted Zn-dependent insulinase-like peptidase
MSEENKDTTVAVTIASFNENSQALVRRVFDGANGLNVQVICIEFSLETDGLKTIRSASYRMRNNDIRPIPIPF